MKLKVDSLVRFSMSNEKTISAERYKIVLEQVHIDKRNDPWVFIVSNGRADASYAYYKRLKTDEAIPKEFEKAADVFIRRTMAEACMVWVILIFHVGFLLK